MAANLANDAGSVSVYDIDQAAVARAGGRGCSPCSTAAEAVTDADVVITMLPAGRHVRQVWNEDIIPHARSGALLIDCSTIDIESARSIHEAASSRGLLSADAPVSGGIMAADAGALTFMVGCDRDVFEAVEAALSPMAKAIIHAGGAGAGQAAKVCNNMLLGISMIGVCEAFALAEKLGLSAERFYDIASKSSGQCWSLTTYCPWPGPVPSAPSNRNYTGGFLSALMLKDLKLAQEAAAASGAATPLGAQAEAMYALFNGLGHGNKDFSAILQLMRGRLSEL
jgi:3-hydroxyisobutyrate dehydrogenase